MRAYLNNDKVYIPCLKCYRYRRMEDNLYGCRGCIIFKYFSDTEECFSRNIIELKYPHILLLALEENEN